MTKRRIRLITDSFKLRPTLDTAVSGAILRRVSDGDEPETLRIYRPDAIVAFGPQDSRSPGFAKAVKASRNAGFDAVRRLGGGRAAVFHEDTIAFALTLHDPKPREHVRERFEEIATIMNNALLAIGVDSHIGEVEGEYCPGDYSVNARGEKKLMGVGQRLIARATHVGGVVVVDGSQRIRNVLVPVYDALDLSWKPETVGSVADELDDVSYDDVRQAILDQFALNYDLYEGELSRDTLALAETMEERHVAE
jgi:lipoate-protein ligase A